MSTWARIIWGLSLISFGCVLTNFIQLQSVTNRGTIVESASDAVEPKRFTQNAEDVEEADAKTDDTDLDSEEPVSELEDVHICVCSDDIDLRAAVVAIRSTMASTAQPRRLVFHYITSPELADKVRTILRQHLAGVRLHVHHDAKLQSHIASIIDFRESSGARQSLASAFNFAPFYLQEYLTGSSSFNSDVKRLIYMDADILVLGDIAELLTLNMHGHSCAAVQYCEQRFKHYINFTQMDIIGMTKGQDPDACIANRGFFVVDVKAWRDQQITRKIELWLRAYSDSVGDLWFGGMSQPPWLLALEGKNYAHLGQEWNCNGLGRSAMNEQESSRVLQDGFTETAFKQMGVDVVNNNIIVPYVATCSTSAKLLHFNGAMKPWLMDGSIEQQPVCAMPKAMPRNLWKHQITVSVSGRERDFVHCSQIWSQFIAESTLVVPDPNLQELFKQRKADEKKWAHALRFEQLKREQELAQAKAQALEKQARLQEKLAAIEVGLGATQ